jgi:hypothetical protein
MRCPSRSLRSLALVACLALPSAACTQVEEFESAYSPTQVEPTGHDGISRVTFTADAVRRAGLVTAKVRRSGRDTSIPYAALIYTGEGATYTYVSPRPRVYVREPVAVDRVAGDRVRLRAGPPAGAIVVTTGAAEVYSAEFGVEE